MNSFEITEGSLPAKFNNAIISNDQSAIVIRCSVKNMDDINEWVTSFGNNSHTQWNARSSIPLGEKIVCSKKFVCHHSAFMKIARDENKKGISKNAYCHASIHVIVKLNTKNTRKKDQFIKVDAIVNAANKKLLGGGGVDGAIHNAAGSSLKHECQTLGGCETGEAKITGGYKLPSKFVIHTVGPVGEKPNFLKNCYVNSLKLATSHNLRTIAFPCISTGIYGYPNEAAAHVATYAVRKYLEQHDNTIERVIFCLFLEVDKKVYEAILQSYFPLK